MSYEQKKNMCSCGSMEIVYDAGDGIDPWGRYRWYASYTCMQCGMSTEIDGGGTDVIEVIDGLPEEVRTFIIQKDGGWQLGVDVSKEVKCFLMSKVFQGLEKDFGSTIALSGTFMQMQWVKNQMLEKGLKEEKIKIWRS